MGAEMANTDITDVYNSVYADGPTSTPDMPQKSRIRQEIAAKHQQVTDDLRAQMDGLKTGIKPVISLDLATTGNVTLSGEQTIDGTLTSASAVLVRGNTDAKQNGAWRTAAGAWTRLTDFDTGAELYGQTFYIKGGTANGSKYFTLQNTTVPTVGSTNLVYDVTQQPNTAKPGALDALRAKGANIASASTVDLSAATGDLLDVTGSVAVTSFGTMAAGIERTVRFTAGTTIIASASIVTPDGNSMTIPAGGTVTLKSLGSGVWQVVSAPTDVLTKVSAVGFDAPAVASRAHNFPDADGVSLAAILDDGRVVGYRRSGGTLVCFGDSITEFSDYPNRIASRLGFKKAINVGFGGERMGQHPDANHDKFSMYQLAASIQANDFSAQSAASAALIAGDGTDHSAPLARLIAIDWNTVSTVTIAYGTNDFGGSLPIGTSADTTGATFRGAIKLSIEKLLTAYPHLELVFITPMWRQRQASGDGKDATNYPNSLGKYLVEYVDAELDQAALYQIPALDNYRSCGINLQTYSRYLDDGLHARTDPGNELLAKRISAFLETLSQ